MNPVEERMMAVEMRDAGHSYRAIALELERGESTAWERVRQGRILVRGLEQQRQARTAAALIVWSAAAILRDL